MSRLNALLEAWALLTRRMGDLEDRLTMLEVAFGVLDAHIRARLKEEAEAREVEVW